MSEAQSTNDLPESLPPPESLSESIQSVSCTGPGDEDGGDSPTLSRLWSQSSVKFDGKEYTKHECTGFMPNASDTENLALQEDVRRRGQDLPILTTDTRVVDGWRRLVAVIAAGQRPRFNEISDEAALAVYLSRNLHRRHLTSSQRAAIASYLQDWSLACTHGGLRDQVSLVPLARRVDRHLLSGACMTLQGDADTVAKKSKPLLLDVIAGRLSVGQALSKVMAEETGTEKVKSEPHAKCKHALQAEASKTAKLEALLATRDAEIEALKLKIDALEQAGTQVDVSGG